MMKRYLENFAYVFAVFSIVGAALGFAAWLGLRSSVLAGAWMFLCFVAGYAYVGTMWEQL